MLFTNLRFISLYDEVGFQSSKFCINFITNGAFTLPDTETDTDTDN